MILGIDPGERQSAFVEYDPVNGTIHSKGVMENSVLLIHLAKWDKAAILAIEYPEPRGEILYRQLITTIFWIGRFVQVWRGGWEKVDRKDVKMELCGKARAKDKNVRAALIDKFAATGGGKTPQIGTKKQPGPLYGVSTHLWAALGVAWTYAQAERERGKEFGI